VRETRIKWASYVRFWENMQPNKNLKKISVAKTDMTDRVLEHVNAYIEMPNICLVELDLSRNLITDLGLESLCTSL